MKVKDIKDHEIHRDAQKGDWAIREPEEDRERSKM